MEAAWSKDTVTGKQSKDIVLKEKVELQITPRFQAYVTMLIIVPLTTINPKGKQAGLCSKEQGQQARMDMRRGRFNV